MKIFLSLVVLLVIFSGYFILNHNTKHENLSILKVDNKYGYKDAKGDIIVKPIYDKVQITPEGLIVVIKKNKLGLIDNKGKILFEPKYESDFSEYRFRYSDGLAAVIKRVQGDEINCVYIDKTGKEVLDPSKYGYSTVQDGEYGSCSRFSEGLAAVTIGKNWKNFGYINKKGELVIKLNDVTGDSGDSFPIGQFSEGLANVPINNKWGYINKKGKFVIKPQFDFAEPFRYGEAEVRINSTDENANTIFYINRKGEILPSVD
jgi:hypothetical protein